MTSRPHFRAVVAIAKGEKLVKALKIAGYSLKTCMSAGRRTLHSREMQREFRHYGIALARDLGKNEFAQSLALLQDPNSSPDVVIQTVKELQAIALDKKPKKLSVAEQRIVGDQSEDANAAFDSLDVRTKERLMLVEAAKIQPGSLADFAKVRIKQMLLDPPEHARDSIAAARTALEMEGQLGGPSELHLHSHTQFPPAVQRMLTEKMLQILQERGHTPEQIPQLMKAEGVVIDAEQEGINAD